MSNQYLEEPGKDLEYVKFTRIETPRTIFFYKRKDAEGDEIEDSDVFACYEQEAGRFGKFHKLVGVGDGKAYYNYLKNASIEELCSQCGGVKTVEQAKLIDGKTQMITIPCPKCDGIGKFQRKLRPGLVVPVAESRRILQEAFNAEFEAAKKDKEYLRQVKPRYENRSFDSTILQHKNAKNIMDTFNPM